MEYLLMQTRDGYLEYPVFGRTKEYTQGMAGRCFGYVEKDVCLPEKRVSPYRRERRLCCRFLG